MTYTFAIDEKNPHLGGNYIEGDPATFCPTAWKYIIEKYNIKTSLDVGSGRGYAAKWFFESGIDVVAIEGLTENVKNAIHPTIEHDLTKESFLRKVDLVNCIEVVEHIEEKFLDNLLDTLTTGNFLLMTHAVPGQEGYHHVNCQPSEYWIEHLKSRKFEFLHDETHYIRRLAKSDKAKHISRNGLFFKNASR